METWEIPAELASYGEVRWVEKMMSLSSIYELCALAQSGLMSAEMVSGIDVTALRQIRQATQLILPI